jgi:hypothetical protein
LRGIGKPPWSLWLWNLCLKFTTQLRDLTDNCMCGVQRWGSQSKILLTTIIAHRVSPCKLLCFVKQMFTPELTWSCQNKGVDYFLTEDISAFHVLLICTLTLTLWGIMWSMIQNLNVINIIFRLSHNKMWKKSRLWVLCEGIVSSFGSKRLLNVIVSTFLLPCIEIQRVPEWQQPYRETTGQAWSTEADSGRRW